MRKKIALITGITGQDGSYLAELLLKKKYKVHGLIRNLPLSIQKESIIFILTRIIKLTFFYIMETLQIVTVFII